MYYVYILQSWKDGNFYTGFATDLRERIIKHNKGLVQSTRVRKPLKLVYYEACINKKDALHREIYLKTAWGKRFVKNRLKNYLVGPRFGSPLGTKRGSVR
ncbi:GIY-YIG nuclease family protein [Candidatus Microgenomates bacterium]|nr:GIY-YIG nuclease family protein [Candidatus Microgenomates bacterium]